MWGEPKCALGKGWRRIFWKLSMIHSHRSQDTEALGELNKTCGCWLLQTSSSPISWISLSLSWMNKIFIWFCSTLWCDVVTACSSFDSHFISWPFHFHWLFFSFTVVGCCLSVCFLPVFLALKSPRILLLCFPLPWGLYFVSLFMTIPFFLHIFLFCPFLSHEL